MTLRLLPVLIIALPLLGCHPPAECSSGADCKAAAQCRHYDCDAGKCAYSVPPASTVTCGNTQCASDADCTSSPCVATSCVRGACVGKAVAPAPPGCE